MIVDKLRRSTRIKSIAVEAFGRHLKRVDASALFLFACKIRLSKLTSQLGKDVVAGVFLLACNFTDAWLLGLNSLRFSRFRIDRGWASLYSLSLMRLCDGTSGLVRGNRRKAVFAFKRLLF